MTKAIIIGSSTAGKTTVIKYLNERHPGLPLDEMDEAIMRVHNGKFPQTEEWRLMYDITVPPIVKQVLESTASIIFFTNSNYFTVEDLKQAKKNGFKIIVMTLDRESMVERNAHRVKHEGYNDLSKYFDKLTAAMQAVIDAGLPDDVIDSTLPIQEVGERIYKNLAHSS